MLTVDARGMYPGEVHVTGDAGTLVYRPAAVG